MSTAARYKVGSGAVAIEDAVPSREGQLAMMMRKVRSGNRVCPPPPPLRLSLLTPMSLHTKQQAARMKLMVHVAKTPSYAG